MSLSATYARIRSGIVAFVPRFPEKLRPGARPHEFIFGTGFIVGESIVATNSHVADVFRQFWNKETKEFDVAAMMFIPLEQGMVNFITQVRQSCHVKLVQTEGFYYGPKSADLALVSVHCKGLSKYALPLNVDRTEEGESIATAGFPMGAELLHLEGQLDHIAPTLQAGIVSAVLPFPTSRPHGYLVNVMVQGGASGSPVFLPETGEVMGVIYASRLDRVQIDLPLPVDPIHVKVPINFSHVVPSHFLKSIIDLEGDNMNKEVPADAPVVDDLIKAMPEKPEFQITKGNYPLPFTMRG